jgi:threonine/homoserine/homoserine lactone efflux protein
MGSVIGEILPLAIGVAISPMPVIAVILMLLAPRAGATALGFLIGWVAGILVAAVAITLIAEATGMSGSGGGSAAAGVVKIILGVLLLGLAVKQFRARGKQAEEPKWLKAIDSVTPGKATGLGFALAAVNPKNLMMIVGAGVIIGAASLSAGQTAVVIAIFTVLAAMTVAVPVLFFLARREQATSWLTGLKTWLADNNATVMMVLFAVIGTVLIGKGIGSL